MSDILAIDAGNSRIKLAVLNTQTLGIECILHGLDWESCVEEVSAMTSMPVWCASVRDREFNDQLVDWFKGCWQQNINFVHTEGQFNRLKNGYRRSEELGVDRWLAMIAASHQKEVNVCVVDVGTAVTIDLVKANGSHAGGVIMPGLKLMRDALNLNTANLDVDAGEATGLCDNTADAVNAGVLHSWLGGIERVLSEVVVADYVCEILVTGGDADLFARHTDLKITIDSGLVLKGIGLVARNHYA